MLHFGFIEIQSDDGLQPDAGICPQDYKSYCGSSKRVLAPPGNSAVRNGSTRGSVMCEWVCVGKSVPMLNGKVQGGNEMG